MSRIASLALAGAFAATMTLSPAAAQTPKRGGILVHGVVSEPANLDLQQSVSSTALGITRPYYSNLVRYDQNNYPAIVADLADSWTISPDGMAYTFKLHPNVKFHDGTPLTSADIKATFERIRNPPQGAPSLRKGDFTEVTAIDTPDPLTVVFRLPEPNASFLDLIANPFNVIYSARKLQDKPLYPATEVMGTGAFTFVEWVRGSHAAGKRFDGYFRPGLPYLDGFRVPIMDVTASVNALSAGQIDAIFRSTLGPEVATMKARLGDSVIANPVTSQTQLFVTINATRKPFDDIRVRRALRLAVDYHAGVEAMSKIANIRAFGGPMRPGYDMALPTAEIEKYPGFGHDIQAQRAEARRLMAEAGQSNLKLRLLNRNQAAYLPSGTFVVSQWKAAGFDAEQDALESTTVISRVAKQDFDLTLDTNVAAADDPTVVLTKFVPGAGTNFAGYKDDVLTDLFLKQRRTIDPSQRREYVHQFERRMLDQALYLPLFWTSYTPAFRSYVKGWTVTATTIMGMDLTEVWLDK